MPNQPERLKNVIQGDQLISKEPQDVLTTVLGSCVAVCMYDETAGIGGMNHFLLPGESAHNDTNVRYGSYAMELLINGLLKSGAQKSKLKAKVFGGARMNNNLRDIGTSNANFARTFLSDEGIPIIAESLGGQSARRLKFWPTSGHVKQLVVDSPADVPEAKPVVPEKPKADADITLF